MKKGLLGLAGVLAAFAFGLFLAHCARDGTNGCAVPEDCKPGHVCSTATKTCVIDPQCGSYPICGLTPSPYDDRWATCDNCKKGRICLTDWEIGLHFCVGNRTFEICDHLSKVGCYFYPNCEGSLGLMVLSDSCVDAILQYVAPDCSINEMDNPGYLAACWESCTGEWKACEGENLAWCQGSWKHVYDCESLCSKHDCESFCSEDEGMHFSGVCGKTSPSGQTSDEDKCWCE
jgi:hypothetical protein